MAINTLGNTAENNVEETGNSGWNDVADMADKFGDGWTQEGLTEEPIVDKDETEAVYTDDTSGWKGPEKSDEPGTQTIEDEPGTQMIEENPDSMANPESGGRAITDPEQIQANREEIMNRLG